MKRSLIITAVLSMTLWISCGDDDGGDSTTLTNTFSATLTGTSSSITEGSGDVLTVGLNFSTAIEPGTLSFSFVENGVAYGNNYTTDPAAVDGTVALSYVAGATSASFTLSVVDDNELSGNGTVTITFIGVDSEESFNEFSYSYTLTLIDDEVPQINPSATSLEIPGAKLGSEGESTEFTYEKLNLTADVTASVDGNFEVADAADGTFGESVTTSATSVFVRYVAGADEELGEVTGALTLTAEGASDVTVSLTSEVLDDGILYFAEYFSTDQYVNSEFYIPVKPDFFGTPVTADYPEDNTNEWVIQNSNRMVEKGGSLSLDGYPGPVEGTTVASIISDQDQSNTILNNSCAERANRNTVLSRRFAADGQVTTGTLILGALVKIEEIFAESETQESMLYGLGGFNTDGSATVHAKTDGAGGFYFGLGKNSEGASDGTDLDPTGIVFHTENYTLNETYAVILSYTVVDGDDNDLLALYVTNSQAALEDIANLQPVVSTSNLNPDITDDIDLSGAGINGFSHFAIRENADKGTILSRFLVTGIRVATTLPSLFGSDPLMDSDPTRTLQTEKTIPDGCTPPDGFR